MSAYEALCKVMMAVPRADGRMIDGVRDIIKAARSDNRQVLLAYPPKVGGTFMRTALIHLLAENFTSQLTRGSYANTDQSRDLYMPSLLEAHIQRPARPLATVMHLHMYPSRHVTEMIEAFDMPVIIATRDILDCLKSSIDMTTGMEASQDYVDDTIISNGKPYPEMTSDERRHSVVHTVTLWYARFYAQWLRYDRECQAESKPAPLWLRYDEFKEEPAAVLMRMARHVDPKHHYAEDAVNAALTRAMENKSEVRFNKGVSGRGGSHFSDVEKRTIYDILAKAGEDDMLRLGVLKPLEASVQSVTEAALTVS